LLEPIVIIVVRSDVTETLKACCGTGGSYNFNKQVTCGHVGTIDNQLVNLTTSTCDNSLEYLSWDGIHHSNTFNKAAATAFLTGKHISPTPGFNCSPDFSNWDART
jgi:alpha-L-fucosidase